MNNTDKLTICYNAWMIYSKNDDYDTLVGEIAERGFNCIRVDDGAGLLWDKDGNVRNDVLISSPFGKYTKFTTYHVIADNKRLNLMERLLRLCAAAKKHNVKLVLSSWFFLHTNWFCEERDVEPLFQLTTEEKMSFFADELSRILDVLKEENLIDVVAFAEIFNEFDGLPFAGEYKNDFPADEALKLRDMHEKEIDKLKEKHPDILFAFDTWTPNVKDEIVPRNIDVLNFHSYYMWPVYFVFQKDLVQGTLEEPEIPDDTRYYLKDELVSVKDIATEMKKVRTGKDWPRRISLYASIDPEKEDELTELLDKELKENFDYYKNRLLDAVSRITATRDRVAPSSKLVMGEGATYCASPTLQFERDSKAFWEMLKFQMAYFKEKGFWGTVVTTTHAPERTIAWDGCKDLYIEANKLFLEDN